MEYLKSEFGMIREMISNLTLDERGYLRYLKAKEKGREHWVKRNRKIG